MNIKKILVAVFALSTTIAFAQEQRIKEESKTIFKKAEYTYEYLIKFADEETQQYITQKLTQ